MNKRINIQEEAPQAYDAMLGLEKYLHQAKLSESHLALIKIRASQINGCAFCINMHTQDAMAHGETAQRIFLLDAWRETELFTTEERIILEMTEQITFIHNQGLTPDLYAQAESIFDSVYIADIIIAIATINAWNRIAISTTKSL